MTREELLGSGLAKLASKDKSQRHYALSDFEMILNQNPNDLEGRFYICLTKALLGFNNSGFEEFLKSDIMLFPGYKNDFGNQDFENLKVLIEGKYLKSTLGYGGKNIEAMEVKRFDTKFLLKFLTNELPKIWLKALKYDELVKEIKQLENES
ncbi:MAG: hypothetical protein MUE81_06480 [Thermoflexibacter sp.]|jgi:hypothetical protein|nr:hypothetical protein [Thermoflexibacter sp.]